MASRRSIDNVAEELKLLSLRSTAGGGGGEILEEDEAVRFANVRRKDFMRLERVRGRLINILEGLELHTGVFSVAEQRRIVDCILLSIGDGLRLVENNTLVFDLKPFHSVVFGNSVVNADTRLAATPPAHAISWPL